MSFLSCDAPRVWQKGRFRVSPASKRAAKSAASDASYARLCSSRQRRTTADVSPPQKPARRRRSASSGTVHVTTRSFQVPSKNSARGTGSTSSNVRGGSGAACESEASESAEDADGDASGAESARGWRMATGASGGVSPANAEIRSPP